MAAIAIFVLPHFLSIGDFNAKLEKNFTKEIVIYALMLPNFARLLPPIIGANQFWSVGVQEQFYFFWPLLMKFFIKRFIPFILVLLGLKLAIEVSLIIALPFTVKTALYIPVKQALQMWQLLLFEQMAIGALGAYFVFTDNKRFLNTIFHPATNLLALATFLALLFVTTEFPGYTVIQGVIALILIMNISINDKFFLKLESPSLNYLGNLSFGMYAYHTACIAIVLQLLKISPFYSNLLVVNIVLYLGSMLLTVAVSALSYRYLESYFLNLKKKYKVVKEGQPKEKKEEPLIPAIE